MKTIMKKVDNFILWESIKLRGRLARKRKGDNQFVGAAMLILIAVVAGALYLTLSKTSISNTFTKIEKSITDTLR